MEYLHEDNKFWKLKWEILSRKENVSREMSINLGIMSNGAYGFTRFYELLISYYE